MDDLDASGDLETQVSQDTIDVTLASTSRSCEPVFPMERKSSLTKAICGIAWIQRFVCNMRKRKEDRAVGDLTYEKLQADKHELPVDSVCLRVPRGLPPVLYSDNAKCLVDSSSQLQRQFGLFASEWRLISPLSTWWGGLSEGSRE